MLLAVDIGNTLTKFGVFDRDILIERFAITTPRDLDGQQLADSFTEKILAKLSDAVVCSVSPFGTSVIVDILQKNGIRAKIVTSDLDFGFKIFYGPLESLGCDRIVNAFSATEAYGTPIIVCSFGTATTLDVISENNYFLGGIIAPGMLISAACLRKNTSQLPEISIETPTGLLGTTTVDAIRSGIVIGHVAMVEGLLHRIFSKMGGEVNVVATGGFAKMIAAETQLLNVVDTDLTLKGLQILHKRFQFDHR